MSRAEIKQLSREALRNADPKGWILLIAIMLVSGLIATVFDNILPLVLGVPMDYIAGELSSYNIPQWKLNVVDILSVVGAVIILPFTLSFFRWALNTARGADNGSFSIIFFGFRHKQNMWQFLLMNVIFTVIIIGLYLAELLLAFFLVALFSLGDSYILYVLLVLAGIFAVAVFGIVLSYRWRLTQFIMAEDRAVKALAAMKESTRLMKGHKAELFVFDISFILWYLLILCTFGLASFWVGSYVMVANATFYRKLIGEIPVCEELTASAIDTEEVRTDYEAYLSRSEESAE